MSCGKDHKIPFFFLFLTKTSSNLNSIILSRAMFPTSLSKRLLSLSNCATRQTISRTMIYSRSTSGISRTLRRQDVILIDTRRLLNILLTTLGFQIYFCQATTIGTIVPILMPHGNTGPQHSYLSRRTGQAVAHSPRQWIECLAKKLTLDSFVAVSFSLG